MLCSVPCDYLSSHSYFSIPYKPPVPWKHPLWLFSHLPLLCFPSCLQPRVDHLSWSHPTFHSLKSVFVKTLVLDRCHSTAPLLPRDKLCWENHKPHYLASLQIQGPQTQGLPSISFLSLSICCPIPGRCLEFPSPQALFLSTDGVGPILLRKLSLGGLSSFKSQLSHPQR